MLGCGTSMCSSSWPTLFSPWHSWLMMRRRTGVESTANNSAALSNTCCMPSSPASMRSSSYIRIREYIRYAMNLNRGLHSVELQTRTNPDPEAQIRTSSRIGPQGIAGTCGWFQIHHSAYSYRQHCFAVLSYSKSLIHDLYSKHTWHLQCSVW